MEVDPITADADGVQESFGAIGAGAGLDPYVSFQNGELGGDPAAFPNVRLCRQTVWRTQHLRAEP